MDDNSFSSAFMTLWRASERLGIYVFRPGADVQVFDDPGGVDGDPVRPGFRLDLSRVW